MSGVVRLRLGDLFDGPSDLIVLPCSTGGTVTDFVANRLLAYTIPRPRRGMLLGEVDIQEFGGAENIAQYVGFACSVLGMTSTEKAIKSIGRAIGQFSAKNPSVSEIAAPLLGAGAGGLPSEVVVEAMSAGFQESAPDKATLTISVLHKSVFQRFSPKQAKPTRSAHPETASPRRVFISYSGTTKEHSEWVASFGTFLRANGVNARLDQWHLRRGMDLPQWMTNEIKLADRVLIISDARYADRADGRSGGVGWETMLIQGDMLGLSVESNKYITIVKEEDFDKGVPRYLKTKFCVHWKNSSDYNQISNEILTEIYESILEPPLIERNLHYIQF